MEIKKFVNPRKFSCNMYVCSSSKGNFIVDPGFFDETIKSYIESIGGVEFVLLTHGHFDHIGGLNLLKENYPEIKIFSSPEEEKVIFSAHYNCSRVMDKPFVPNIGLDYLSEGKNKIGNYVFNVIFTPGHTIGSIMIYLKEEKVLFLGDTILVESIGRTDLPTSSYSDMYNSLNKLKKFTFSNETMCYFGHGRNLKWSELKEVNIYLR